MKCNVLKRAFVLTALGASMATAAFAASNGPVMIPQPGTVVDGIMAFCMLYTCLTLCFCFGN